MNQKLDELIVAYAYGEATDEQMRLLELKAALDPKIARQLAQQQSIARSMVALQDIPDHQLSTERLRDALLKDGLKRQEAPKPWIAGTLAWAGFAGVAAFALLFVTRQLPKSDVGSVARREVSIAHPFSDLSKAAGNVALNDTPNVNLDAFIESGAAASMPKASAVEATHVKRVQTIRTGAAHLKSSDPTRLASQALSKMVLPAGESEDPQGLSKMEALNAPAPTIVSQTYPEPIRETPQSLAYHNARATRMLLASHADATGPIVTIQNDSDGNTGLPSASEVSKKDDVLLGG